MNPKYPHPILAREGWPFIGVTFAVALLWTLFVGFGFVAAILWVLCVLVTQFFRDPAREVPAMTDASQSVVNGMSPSGRTSPYAKLLYLSADVIASSSADSVLYNPFSGYSMPYRDFFGDKKNIFLQLYHPKNLYSIPEQSNLLLFH